MRRKVMPKSEPEQIVPAEILEQAKQALTTDLLASDKLKTFVKCMVCGGETTTGLAEQLCWVCRRLKISAWRDIEQQIPAQE